MNLLALDTSTDALSVGVLAEGEATLHHVVEPRAHTRLLVPAVEDSLARAGLCPRDLDAVVLGNGPGSFIGMRIGAALAQGIAFAAGLPLVPVSSLETIAAEVFAETSEDVVFVAQDARMGEVYLGEYRREGEMPRQEGDLRLHAAGTALGCPGTFAVAGGGWRRHPGLLESLPEGARDHTRFEHPRARQLLALGRRDVELGRSIAPEALEPAYLRQRVAAPAAQRP